VTFKEEKKNFEEGNEKRREYQIFLVNLLEKKKKYFIKVY
jgi:hypothetical protein